MISWWRITSFTRKFRYFSANSGSRSASAARARRRAICRASRAGSAGGRPSRAFSWPTLRVCLNRVPPTGGISAASMLSMEWRISSSSRRDFDRHGAPCCRGIGRQVKTEALQEMTEAISRCRASRDRAVGCRWLCVSSRRSPRRRAARPEQQRDRPRPPAALPSTPPPARRSCQRREPAQRAQFDQHGIGHPQSRQTGRQDVSWLRAHVPQASTRQSEARPKRRRAAPTTVRARACQLEAR